MKKFQNLIGFPVRLYDNTLDIINRGLRVLGVPLGFTVGGLATGPQVTAAALTAACVNGAIPAETTAPLNIYLATAPDGGNDTTGDGTITRPFLTFNKALSIVPRILRHKVTLFPKKGIYNGFPKDNFFKAQGGQLIIDGSNETATIFKANCVVDSIVSIGDPENVGNDQAWKITGLAAAWMPDKYCFLWVRFKTGACAGRYFPIWRNTATEVIIGLGAQGVLAADIFDIVFLPVQIMADDTINFDFGREREYNYYSFSDNVDLGIANCWFAWSLIPSNTNLMVIKNTNCCLGAVNLMHMPNGDASMLTAVNADINSRPVSAGTFIDPIFDVLTNNWLNCPSFQGYDQPSGSGVMWLTDSALCQVAFPGTIWVSGKRSNAIQTGLLWFVNSSTACDLQLYNLFFDSRIIGGDAISLVSSNLQILNCFIYDEEFVLNLRDGSSLNCTWLKMKALGVRGSTACKFENGVSAKIQVANCNLAGTSLIAAAVKFSMGDASGYNTLAVAGSVRSDTTDCWIHSV